MEAAGCPRLSAFNLSRTMIEGAPSFRGVCEKVGFDGVSLSLRGTVGLRRSIRRPRMGAPVRRQPCLLASYWRLISLRTSEENEEERLRGMVNLLVFLGHLR